MVFIVYIKYTINKGENVGTCFKYRVEPNK